MLRSDFGSALVSGAQKSGALELVGFSTPAQIEIAAPTPMRTLTVCLWVSPCASYH